MRLLAGVLALACLAASAHALQYVNDEQLWTKQRWGEFMLDFPWDKFKTREPEYNRLAQELADLEGHTLNGPHGNIDELVAGDRKRGSRLRHSRFEVSVLDDQASLEAAAGVAQCKACVALATALWEGLVAWVDRHQKLPSLQHIRQFAEQLCEHEVVNSVLGDWVILRARVEQGMGSPLRRGGQEFYMLSQRSKEHATPQEMDSAHRACETVLSNEAALAAKNDVVSLASSLLQTYCTRMQVRLGKAPEGEVVLRRMNEGPKAERGCYDRHPQCDYWAKMGECTGNPVYMTGNGDPEKGWCRLACRTCVPARPAAPALGAEEATFLRSAAADLLGLLHSKGCVSSPACQLAAGEASSALLAKASGDAAALVQQAAFISGPIKVGAGEEEDGAELDGAGYSRVIDEARLASSRASGTRALTDALVAPHHQPARPGGKAQRPFRLERPEQLATATAQELWKALGNKCIYISTGYWTYEVCPWHRINQVHVTQKNQPEWVICLGLFNPDGAPDGSGASNWTLRNTTLSGLYPEGALVPYVLQAYTEGNLCELTEPQAGSDGEGKGAAAGADAAPDAETAGDEGSGGGGGDEQQHESGSPPRRKRKSYGTILRETELRIMCSPDQAEHILISEPQQCIYVVELYVPQLCALEGFAVHGVEQAAGRGQRRERAGGPVGSVMSGPEEQEEEDEYEDPEDEDEVAQEPHEDL